MDDNMYLITMMHANAGYNPHDIDFTRDQTGRLALQCKFCKVSWPCVYTADAQKVIDADLEDRRQIILKLLGLEQG